MVRYFLTDLRGNPIYSFAQRLRRNNQQQQQQQQLLLRNTNRLFSHAPPVVVDHHSSLPHLDHDDTAMMIPTAEDGDSSEASKSPPDSTVPPQLLLLYHVSNFSSMTLVCYVRNQQWDDVMKRIHQVPYQHEIYMVDTITGNTILHTVCRYNPPSYIIQALCNPSTIRSTNYDGTTPLHIAASHRCSKDALQTLFDCCRLYYQDVVAVVTDVDKNNHQNKENVEDVDEEEDEKKHPPPSRPPHQHTSPTADLSRIGRAPIHYACMSFRGLDIEAFKLLLNETLQYGNIWVYENDNNNNSTDTNNYGGTATNYYNSSGSCGGCHRDNDIMDDMDDLDLEYNDCSIGGGGGGGKKGMMEVVNENEVYDEYEECRDDHHHHDSNDHDDHPILYEFENETDHSLYQLYGSNATETMTGWKSSCSSVENDYNHNNATNTGSSHFQ